MTGEQANWIRANKGYSALSSRVPSGHVYAKRGMLHPDGTFELKPRTGRYARISAGGFEVGVLQPDQDLARR